jgi:hypothetical protein
MVECRSLQHEITSLAFYSKEVLKSIVGDVSGQEGSIREETLRV